MYSSFFFVVLIQSGYEPSPWDVVLSIPTYLLDIFEMEPAASDHYFFFVYSAVWEDW